LPTPPGNEISTLLTGPGVPTPDSAHGRRPERSAASVIRLMRNALLILDATSFTVAIVRVAMG
jgi:hypothetical protein